MIQTASDGHMRPVRVSTALQRATKEIKTRHSVFHGV